jgi:multiple sugar transport system permease protein
MPMPRGMMVGRLNGRQLVRKVGAVVGSIMRAAFVIAISFLIIRPFLATIAGSVMRDSDLFDQTVRWISRSVSVENYLYAFEGMKYPKAFANSVVLCSLVGLVQLISCTLVGYGLARFHFRGENLIFALVILTLIVPPQIILIPLFLNLRFFYLFGLLKSPVNLIGTLWPFVLSAATATGFKNGLFIYVMRQFFRGMSRNLEEAAYIDGASAIRTFFVVMLPNAVPAMVTVFLFSFVWQWNDYFFTGMYLQGGTFLPMTLDALRFAVGPTGQTEQAMMLQVDAGMVLFILPLLVLYMVMQRYFIESVERTGLVG